MTALDPRGSGFQETVSKNLVSFVQCRRNPSNMCHQRCQAHNNLEMLRRGVLGAGLPDIPFSDSGGLNASFKLKPVFHVTILFYVAVCTTKSANSNIPKIVLLI